MGKYIACLIIALITMPATAEDLTKSLIACSALSDGVKRIECFDGLAASEQKIADAAAKAKLDVNDTPDNWTAHITQSKIDDSTTVVLSAESQESIPSRFHQLSKPSLILRCLENTTSAYVDFDGHHMADIQSYGKVTFRVDKDKAFTRSMRASTNSKALGLWRGNSSIPFIKKLFGGTTLLIQATPFNESAITFSVDISGLETAIKPLRTACNW